MISTNMHEILMDVKNGKPLIVIDAEDRENEGDFFVNAEVANEESIRLMLNFGKGLICTPLTNELSNKLNLPLMVQNNTTNLGTAFTVSIDHKSNTTGISLTDRLKTIKELANPKSSRSDFLRPGHIFPLIAHKDGLLGRDGHTEAAVELSKLAKLPEVGVICEILNNSGDAANLDELKLLAKEFNLKIVTIDFIKDYIQKNIEYDKTSLPTEFGEFNLYNFYFGQEDILVLSTKNAPKDGALLRVHSECKTGDIFGSHKCDCGKQLKFSMKKIFDSGNGILIYLNQEGRGIGIRNKIKAYELQDQGLDTFEANNKLGFPDDLRTYEKVEKILKFFNVNEVNIISNNPHKINSLREMGIKILDEINTDLFVNIHNQKYLHSKIKKTKHKFLTNLKEISYV